MIKIVTKTIDRLRQIMSNIGQRFLLSRGYGYKSNVMTPLYWITAFVFSAGVIGIRENSDLFTKIFCMSIIFIMISLDIGIYLYWTKINPDRLQTEKYRLENRKIDIIASKSGLPLNDNNDLLIEERPVSMDQEIQSKIINSPDEIHIKSSVKEDRHG